MAIMNDMKFCPVCARYDWWYMEALRTKCIKIKKRKGIEYLTLTVKGIKEGMKEGNIPKIPKKDWDKKVKLMATPKISVEDFKKKYVDTCYIRNRKTGVVQTDFAAPKQVKKPKKRKENAQV
jgi:hypothetical protein